MLKGNEFPKFKSVAHCPLMILLFEFSGELFNNATRKFINQSMIGVIDGLCDDTHNMFVII